MRIRDLLIAAVLGLAHASPGRADEVSLISGESFAGTVLAGGPTRIVVEGQQGPRFFDRTDVRCVLDAVGALVVTQTVEADPIGVVRVVAGGVRVQRQGDDISLSVQGSSAVVLEGDVLRTTPYGRVTLLVPGGASVSARSDAVLRFRQGLVELVEGTLRIEHEQGTARVLVPEGRLVVVQGRAEVEHVRGRSRVVCVSGRTVLQATEGYSLELPRNHTADVKTRREGESGSITASNANAWPLRLEQGSAWSSIQPGERALLMGGVAARPAEPPPVPLERPERPAPLPPREDLTTLPERRPERPADGATRAQAGAVVRAGAKFQLDRLNEASRRVEPAEAAGFALWPGDALATDQGDVWLEATGARVQVLAGGRLVLRSPEGGPAFRVEGQASFETDGQLSVGVPGGEVGLLRGAMIVKSGAEGAALRVSAGTAGARFGDEVRAELLAPAEVSASVDARGRVRLNVPPDTHGVEVTAGTLDVRVPGRRGLSHRRTGDLQTIELWNGATLELVGQVRARVVPGPSETELLVVDGLTAPLPLVPGTYRIGRDAGGVRVYSVPAEANGLAQGTTPTTPPQPQPTPQRPPAAPAQPAAAGAETVTLRNGAVLLTRGWGPVRVLRDGLQEVEVEGPNGSLFLGFNVRATLTRRDGLSRVETSDGRWIEHEIEAGPFDLWLAGDGRLRVNVRGEALPRKVEVEPGCRFDLTIRRDRYVLANVFGQLVYVDLGQEISVTRQSGLRIRPGR